MTQRPPVVPPDLDLLAWPAGSWRAEPALRWGARAWSLVGMLVAGFLLLRLLRLAQVLLAPLLVAVLLVYLLNPVVRALNRRGLPRPAGTALAALVVLVVLAVGAVLLVPVLLEQVRAALAALPTDLEALEARLDRAAARLGLGVDVDLDGVAVQAWLADAGNRRLLFGSLSTVGSVLASAAEVLIAVLAGSVLALFVLSDLPGLRQAVLSVVPPARRGEVAEVAGEVGAPSAGSCAGRRWSPPSSGSPPRWRCG